MRPLIRYGLRLVGPALLLYLWQVAYDWNLLNRSLLPSPADTALRLWQLIYTGDIGPDLAATLVRMLAGFMSASVIGMVLGLVIGGVRPLYQALEFTIDFFRSLPVTTLYPLFVLFFGIGHASKIAMVFVASVFVVTLNSAYGVVNAGAVRTQMARLYGATATQRFRWITFYDALPQSLIGMRVALSYSLIVEIVAEMFMGSQVGLGQRVFEAYSRYAIDDLYAIILITGVMGYLLNRLFVLVERRLVDWGPR